MMSSAFKTSFTLISVAFAILVQTTLTHTGRFFGRLVYLIDSNAGAHFVDIDIIYQMNSNHSNVYLF